MYTQTQIYTYIHTYVQYSTVQYSRLDYIRLDYIHRCLHAPQLKTSHFISRAPRLEADLSRVRYLSQVRQAEFEEFDQKRQFLGVSKDLKSAGGDCD